MDDILRRKKDIATKVLFEFIHCHGIDVDRQGDALLVTGLLGDIIDADEEETDRLITEMKDRNHCKMFDILGS